VFAKSILSPERDGTQTEVFGLRRQPAEAKRSGDSAFGCKPAGLVLFQSGVASALPPQSKISHFNATLRRHFAVFILRQRFPNRPMIGYG
jgi:hypothetical protein